ncbi:MAG: hypothetical protein A2045_17000 [Rhodocyclales bacterium GWA2_65_20]|nr:MAG: hypothetical protein A2045_17000 [Rhodocyclales bacterium GWA2_65_20]
MASGSDTGLFTFAQKARYWDELYAHPSNLFEHNMRLRRDYAAQYIRAHFDKSAALLDLGCGAGVLSEKLIENGFPVTAADGSLDMLELSRQRLQRFPAASYRLLHANCLSLPFHDGEFDLVVCLGVFGYFDEVTQALREIHRVLRPGGTLIVSVRNAQAHYVFDLFRLLQLPWRLLRVLARHLTRQSRPSGPVADTAGAVRTNGVDRIDDGFRIQIHQVPSRLIEGVTQRGYALAAFDGFGYGPVRFAGKELFPTRFSVRFSDFLNRGFRAAGLDKFSRWVADVSFYVFHRRD